MGNNQFLEILKKVLGDNKLDIRLTLADLVSRWSEFVEQCEEGYQYSLYDYDSELTIRDNIELIICNQDLQKYNEHQEFIERISLIDQRFKAILKEYNLMSEDKWWKRGVLKYAGEQYAKNVKTEWNIEIEIMNE